MIRRLLLVFGLLAGGTAVWAQSPPTDLTELDIEEILALHIKRADEGATSRWSVGYRFVWIHFDGNRDGTEDVPIDDILWDGPSGDEARTRDNFPVVPLVIHQQAHLFEVGYDLTERLGLRLLVPFIWQETDHCSILPGFESFIITSSGIGDVHLSASYPVWSRDGRHLLLTGGVSLPVGSIEELGRTPRDAERDTQLPYTMQVGSGTLDLMPGIVFASQRESLRWGGEVRGTLRLGETDRDYTLGDRLGLTLWARRPVTGWFEAAAQMQVQRWGRIDGEDRSLRIDTPEAPAPFPYPAAVTDPSKFGGTKVIAQVGANLAWPGRALAGHSVDIEAGLPVYQDLNGPQPKEVWRLGVAWNWDL